MSKSSATEFHKRSGVYETRKKQQYDMQAKTRSSKKTEQLESGLIAVSNSFNKKTKQGASKQFEMELKSGRRVGDNESPFIPSNQNSSLNVCSDNGKESGSDYLSRFEQTLTETKQECNSDLKCDVSFVAFDQDAGLDNHLAVIGDIVPKSWFNSERETGGQSSNVGLAATKMKQTASEKQYKMELRSGRLISCHQQSCDVAGSSDQPSLENLAGSSDVCDLRHTAAADDVQVSASHWRPAGNGVETLYDLLSEIKQECGYMHGEDLNYAIGNDETAITQDCDNVHAEGSCAGISVIDSPLDALLSCVPRTETVFEGVSDVHSTVDEPPSISSQLPCNQSQLACDDSARTVDIMSLSQRASPSAGHNMSDGEYGLMEPFAASCVCEQLCTSDNAVEHFNSLLHDVDNARGTNPLEEIACGDNRDTVEPSNEHDLIDLPATHYVRGQLKASDEHQRSLAPNTSTVDEDGITTFDETCYDETEDSEQLQTSDDSATDYEASFLSRDEDNSDINLVNSTLDVCLGRTSTPIQNGDDSDTAELKAYSGLCRVDAFKELQATQNDTQEQYVEPVSWAGNDEIHRDINTFDAMSDSQNGEEYHIHSTEHSNLNAAVAVEPLFEINQQTDHKQSNSDDMEHSEVNFGAQLLSRYALFMCLQNLTSSQRNLPKKRKIRKRTTSASVKD